jgi:hypothetical protein
MKSKKIKAMEGYLVAVPLNQNGYGLGLVARKNKRVCLGYFFNRVYSTLPMDVSPGEMDKKDVILIAKFSSLGIEDGSWPIIKSLQEFNPFDWPIPVFQGKDYLAERYFAIVYEEDIMNEKKRYSISQQEASTLFEHGLHGYISLQNALSKRLMD